jgi:hypothetical protein
MLHKQPASRKTTKCPCCSSANTQLLAFGVVAPWIAELFGCDHVIKTELSECSDCGLRFFGYRYSDSEMEAIYSHYRGEESFNLRRRWEPWINRGVNDAFSGQLKDKSPIDERKLFTARSLIGAGIDIGRLRGVIDFGGDLGQFIPDSISPPLIVYEPNGSRTNLAADVTTCTDLSALPFKVDLGLNCYVLEHVSSPRSTLNQMVECVNRGKYIHVEVPLDYFRTSRFHRSHLYLRYLQAIIRFRVLWIVIDFLGGVWRTYRRSIPWFGIVKQSEHINYFETNSLKRLLDTAGLTTIHLSDEDLKYSVGRVRQGRLSITAIV